MSKVLLAASALLALLAAATAAPRTEDESAARAQRWQQLQGALFPGRQILDGSGVIDLQAPQRAPDAALVPVELRLKGRVEVRGVYLVIDENPAPLAAHFTFGPEADPHSVKLRVRVDQYTNMHALAETTDGRLYAAERFIKAAGGCSAPAGADDAEAMASVGIMKLRLMSEFNAGQPMQAQLMIRHPNFNGMQMDQVKRTYTPARFIHGIDVNYEGRNVFHLDSDIALSTDPVITFGFVPKGRGQMDIVVHDSSNATFHHSFQVPES